MPPHHLQHPRTPVGMGVCQNGALVPAPHELEAFSTEWHKGALVLLQIKPTIYAHYSFWLPVTVRWACSQVQFCTAIFVVLGARMQPLRKDWWVYPFKGRKETGKKNLTTE